MSRSHDGLWMPFHIGNPFRITGDKASSKLVALQNCFEQNLAESMRKLCPKKISDIFSFSWIKHAIRSLSEVHSNINTLIMELQLPVSEWQDEWIETYLNSTVKLLDVCVAFSAELSQLAHGQLLLRYVLHILNSSISFPSSEQLRRARASLGCWLKQSNSWSPKLENCHAILQSLGSTLSSSKVKRSSKGRVLMRALYGVEVMTLFTCIVVEAALTGCSEHMMDLHVADKFLWLEAFNDLQAFMNEEIRRQLSCKKDTVLKEMDELEMSVLVFQSLTKTDDCKEEARLLSIDLDKDELAKHADTEQRQRLQECIRVLTDGGEVLGYELDSLSKQVNEFFQILLTGRDALLFNFRASRGIYCKQR